MSSKITATILNVLLELGGRISELVYLLSVRFGGLIVLNLFTRHAHYMVTKHSREVRLILLVAVTARVYLSRGLEHRIICRRLRYLPGCCT
jgi:hypothetical protein